MKRVVALKVMSPAAVKTPDALQRFHREVETAATLSHPNIVAAHDADEVNATHFLVMEYVEGADLSASVKKQGPLPVETAALTSRPTDSCCCSSHREQVARGRSICTSAPAPHEMPHSANPCHLVRRSTRQTPNKAPVCRAMARR